MLEMKDELLRLASENPMVDLSKGVSEDCGEVLDNGMRCAARGTPWNETYESINSVIDKFIEEINSK